MDAYRETVDSSRYLTFILRDAPRSERRQAPDPRPRRQPNAVAPPATSHNGPAAAGGGLKGRPV